MKIFYDEQIFQHCRYGGVARYFTEIINQFLSKHIDEVDISLFRGFYINQYNFKHQENFKNLWSFNQLASNKLSKIHFLLNYIGSGCISRFGQYDVYHPTDYRINKLVDGKIKRIITVHDMTQEKFPQLCRR
jgi:hypothetical protein